MIGLVMAPQPRGIPLSPVSIAGLPALAQLAQRCRDAGHDFIDRAGPEHAERLDVALWDFGSIAVKPSWIKAHTRTVAWSLESPLVAHRAYHRLNKIALESDVILGYPGVEQLLGGSGDFRPLYWPMTAGHHPSTEAPWENRRFAVMINSNKSVDSLRGQLSWREPRLSARRVAAALLSHSYGLRRTWRVPNLYRQRLRLITAFADHDGFDLWGVGWDRPIPGVSRSDGALVRSVYRGSSPDKIVTLGDYRFALCIENTRFPGYVSEKIFDAFRAGTIPVYLGAPDIVSYLPPSSFIDAEAFADTSLLVRRLLEVTPSEADQMLDAGASFLTSGGFQRFTDQHFITTMMDAAGKPQ